MQRQANGESPSRGACCLAKNSPAPSRSGKYSTAQTKARRPHPFTQKTARDIDSTSAWPTSDIQDILFQTFHLHDPRTKKAAPTSNLRDATFDPQSINLRDLRTSHQRDAPSTYTGTRGPKRPSSERATAKNRAFEARMIFDSTDRR
jgi:hypothetical protein